VTQTIVTAVKAALMTAIMQTVGLYAGAILIALIAALARLAYTAEKASLNLFGRFFIMSLSLTMLLVHVGELQGWDKQLTIIISGVSAFLCREILETLINSKSSLVQKLLKVLNL